MPGRVGPWGDTQEDGLPGYLLYQVTAPAPAKAQVPFQGMDSPSLEDVPFEISVPDPASSSSSSCSTSPLQYCRWAPPGVIFSSCQNNRASPCWISCKEMWKVRFWSTCPGITVIFRIRAVTAFSFVWIHEAKVANAYQWVQNSISRMLQPSS